MIICAATLTYCTDTVLIVQLHSLHNFYPQCYSKILWSVQNPLFEPQYNNEQHYPLDCISKLWIYFIKCTWLVLVSKYWYPYICCHVVCDPSIVQKEISKMTANMYMMRYYMSFHGFINYIEQWCRLNPFIIDEAMKRHIKPHHVHIGSHFTYFFLNYVFIGSMKKVFLRFKKCYQILASHPQPF